MKKLILKTLSAILIMLLPVSAFGATMTMTANIAFDTPLGLTKKSDISFGTVKAGVADTYTITTAGNVVAAGSGQIVSGSGAAGNITITGSTTQTLNISVSGYTASNGVTPANAKCAYAGGTAGSCNIAAVAAPGAGKTLLLGVDAVVDGTQAPGATASPSFTVTIVYG